MIERDPSQPGLSPDRLVTADPEAWHDLVEAYWPRMVRAAERMLSRPQDAEDACQEALLGAFRSLPRYEPDRPFEPWLFGILNRVCLKRLRTRRRHPEVELPPAVVQGEGEPLELDLEEDRRRLRRVLDELPDRDRFLIVARYYQGLTNRDIAGTLGLTPNAVGVAVFRAMEGLRRRMRRP